jgi:hypothetical protein
MTNPAEKFLVEKRAFGLGGAANAAKSVGRAVKPFGQAAGMAMAGGVGAAGFAGLVGAAGKLFTAATKSRDFRAMLEANPDLKEHQKMDPGGFNRMYSSLHTMAPEFAKEPMVAGYYMRQGMEAPLEGRGQVAVQAMNARKPQQMGPVSDMALQGYMRSMGGKPDGGKQLLRGQTKTTYAPGDEGVVQRVETTDNHY